MNSSRLSTKSGKGSAVVDRALLTLEIDKLLKGPSNYEVREGGRIFIKSLNKYLSSNAKAKVEIQDEKGNTIKLFDSMADCAKFLGVARMTVTNKLLSGKPILFENKTIFIKKSHTTE
jgi:hypothetical protein